MKIDRTTYVEFLSPGSPYANTRVEETTTRDPSKIAVPRNVYGFRFFDILSTSVWDGDSHALLISERINKSHMYYYGGDIHTLTQIKRMFPRGHSLIRNIERYGYKKMVHCRDGGWRPLCAGDAVIPIA